VLDTATVPVRGGRGLVKYTRVEEADIKRGDSEKRGRDKIPGTGR